MSRPLRYAVSWSGGKDSLLALDRAREAGLDVACALNLFHGPTGRVAYHGVPHELVALQLARLGLEPIQLATGDDDYEAVFLAGLDRLIEAGVRGIVFGNVHLADVRAWYEERTTGRGLEHVEPLWHEAAATLLGELVARGHRARVVSVDRQRGDEAWLGRELDAGFAAELLAGSGYDPVGEHGEYHSFAHDGPLFSAPLELREAGRFEMRGHALIELATAGTDDR